MKRRLAILALAAGPASVQLRQEFFFDVTLDRGTVIAKMQPRRVPRTLTGGAQSRGVSHSIAAAHFMPS